MGSIVNGLIVGIGRWGDLLVTSTQKENISLSLTALPVHGLTLGSSAWSFYIGSAKITNNLSVNLYIVISPGRK